MSALVYISMKHVSVMFLFSKGKDANEPKAHANGRSLTQFPWHDACLVVLLLRPGRDAMSLVPIYTPDEERQRGVKFLV